MSKQMIRIVGANLDVVTRDDGRFLSFYDPHDGEHGRIETTADVDKALVFDNAGAALECWKQVNRNKPVRPDGKPNRPLTAFTVELVQVKS